jgi:hypothetical protein
MEDQADRRHRAEGLVLPADTLRDLARVAREAGVEALLPFSID